MATLRQKNLPPVSLTLLALVGLTIGCAKGVLGIGGGIILVPFLVLIVGLTPHRAVATSLGMVVMSSLVGTILYAANGYVNFFLVAAIMIGSLLGVILGAKFCNVTSPKRLKPDVGHSDFSICDVTRRKRTVAVPRLRECTHIITAASGPTFAPLGCFQIW